MSNPFSIFDPGSTRRERCVAHIVREHRLGRPLDAILGDPYLRRYCTPEQVRLLLERPELVRALGEDVAREGRAIAERLHDAA